MALGLLAPKLMAQDTLIVNLSLKTSDFSFGNQDGYDVITSKLEGMGYITIPGHPLLPIWYPTYIIPYWRDIAYVQALALDSVQIPGTYNIYPAQRVPIDGNPIWIPPDSAIYNSDSPYPGNLLDRPGSGVFDGARITTLNLYPIQYRPKSGRLFLYTNATLKLVFKDAEPPINAKQRYEHVQEIYDKMLALLVENDTDISRWYRRPTIIDLSGGKNEIPFMTFIIITTEAQAGDQSLLAYRDWMDQKGYPTAIQTIEWILANVPGIDPAEKLRNYISDSYQLGVSFFLLLGNVSGEDVDMPYRKMGPSYIGTETYQQDGLWQFFFLVPSDLYYSEIDLDWDTNDDGFYGVWNGLNYSWWPPSDGITEPMICPEVFVGRVVAKTNENDNEIANWVNKVIIYEKNPGNTNGLTHV
ncbi:MAG: C25 family cysteine peptidase, partial [candidate division WOR-3 bacterium]